VITSQDRARAADFLAAFEATGARPVTPPILQPAGTLLDLYGEDIRARAFTTTDPLRGEVMLRPDFTVPVVQTHMQGDAAPARYCYAGEVFRRQETDDGRPREYLQVGFEIFDGADPAAADAEVFDLISRALAPWGAQPAMGDLGLLIAAVEGLSTSPRRRAALRRHIWRPRRFRRLMDRFTGRAETPATRAALLARLALEAPAELLAEAGPSVGLRDAPLIEARLAALAEEAALPPIARAEAEAIEAVLSLAGSLADAIGPIRDLAVDLPGLDPAADRLEARADALSARGYDPGALPFAPARGRSAMEYYDGFTFTFSAPGRPDLPPLATGGRYDALTAALGGDRSIPAVGGVLRPGLLSELALESRP
jgi:ATP phosphoribosyltransferase regulatory subunit